MNYLIVSYHISRVKTKGIADLTWDDQQLQTNLRSWMAEQPVQECFYLATCNRVEFLFYSTNIDALMESLSEFMPIDLSMGRIYSARASVVQHLLEVSLSMDSLVFGESQILGQMKKAYQLALKNGFCSAALSPLIQAVLKHSKKIRTKNHLSNIHSSVGSVAAKDLLIDGNHQANILFVGAGESNRLVARYLSKRSVKNITWTNRTHERAQEAVDLIGGDILSWVDFEEVNLGEFEVVFLTTNAGKILFTEEHLSQTKVKRVYDLSVPANADQKTVQSLGSEYIGMDVLETILAKEKIRFDKLKAIMKKDTISAMDEISASMDEKELNPVISESLENIDLVVSDAMNNLPHDLKGLSEKQVRALKLWTRGIVQKTKHEHISQIKRLRNTKK